MEKNKEAEQRIISEENGVRVYGEGKKVKDRERKRKKITLKKEKDRTEID